MPRLLTLVAVLVVVGVSAVIGNGVGMPASQAAPLGLLATGITTLSLHLVFGDGAADSPITAAASIMLLFAALGNIALGRQLFPGANGFLLFAGVIAVEVVATLLLTCVVSAVTQRVVRSGLAKDRRDLATSRGWQFEPSDADLPSMFDGVDHFVVHVPGRPPAFAPRIVPKKTRAHDVVRGEAGGVEFVAFDFFAPRRLRLPEVTTACVVRLPQPLSLFTSAEVVRRTTSTPGRVSTNVGAQGRDHSTTTTNPDDIRAMMTEDVVRFTRWHLASWWAGGHILASTARMGHGAPPDVLMHNIEAITQLATVLSLPQNARYGSSTAQPNARTRAT